MATGLGSFLFLTPKAIVIALVVFLVALVVFRFVALGSILASASLPISALLLREVEKTTGITMLSAAAFLVVTLLMSVTYTVVDPVDSHQLSVDRL